MGVQSVHPFAVHAVPMFCLAMAATSSAVTAFAITPVSELELKLRAMEVPFNLSVATYHA